MGNTLLIQGQYGEHTLSVFTMFGTSGIGAQRDILNTVDLLIEAGEIKSAVTQGLGTVTAEKKTCALHTAGSKQKEPSASSTLTGF